MKSNLGKINKKIAFFLWNSSAVYQVPGDPNKMYVN